MIEWDLSRTFSYAGSTVRYDVQGSGPPLVLVHGTPWSSFNWRQIIPALARSYTVYFYDLLGYGQSEKKAGQDVSLGVQNQLLAALLDHWELHEPLIVGHDFGGTTVLRAHLLNERRFSKMALVDPVAVAPWGSPFFAHVRRHEQVFQGIPNYIHEAMVAAYVKGAAYRPMSAGTVDAIVRPWLGPDGQSAFYRQIAQADQRFTDEIESRYGTMTSPVLILWGEQDEWIPLSRGRQLHRAVPTSQFHTIPDAGNLVQEDAPTLLVAHLLDFFAD